jgi:hypothetical protein
MRRIKLYVATMTLAGVMLLGGCGKTEEVAEVTTEEATTEEPVREVVPLTLADMDKMLTESSFIKQMQDSGSTITTEVTDSAYTITVGMSGAEYACTFSYADGVLTGELSADAQGYLTYLMSNYIANEASEHFGNDRGYIDYLYSLSDGTVGSLEEYGFELSSDQIQISLNDINFTDMELGDVSVSEDKIKEYLDSDDSFITTDNYGISVSNGFISLTTNNSDKNWYEINVVALNNDKLDMNNAVYFTFTNVCGFYNNGDVKFFTDEVSSSMMDVEKEDITFQINNAEKVASVVDTADLDESQFTVYTLRFKTDKVTPITESTEQKTTSTEEDTEEKGTVSTEENTEE